MSLKAESRGSGKRKEASSEDSCIKLVWFNSTQFTRRLLGAKACAGHGGNCRDRWHKGPTAKLLFKIMYFPRKTFAVPLSGLKRQLRPEIMYQFWGTKHFVGLAKSNPKWKWCSSIHYNSFLKSKDSFSLRSYGMFLK